MDEAKIQKKWNGSAERSVGKEFRVRIDRSTTCLGTITACRFLGMAKMKPQFEVTMSCGVLLVERKFTVAKLP